MLKECSVISFQPPPSQAEVNAFRAGVFIDTAKRLEVRAAKLMDEARIYRERAAALGRKE